MNDEKLDVWTLFLSMLPDLQSLMARHARINAIKTLCEAIESHAKARANLSVSKAQAEIMSLQHGIMASMLNQELGIPTHVLKAIMSGKTALEAMEEFYARDFHAEDKY